MSSSSASDSIPRSMGAIVKRREDPALITGKGKYTADVQISGLLHMAVVRSPYAHARIVSVDTAPALQVPGVVAAVAGAEVNPLLTKQLAMVIEKDDEYTHWTDPIHPVLTTDKARYVNFGGGWLGQGWAGHDLVLRPVKPTRFRASPSKTALGFTGRSPKSHRFYWARP